MLDAHQPRGGVEECVWQIAKTLLFHEVSPSICVSSICHSSGSKSLSSCSLFYRFIALLLNNIFPSSNHPLQLPITRQVRAVYMCDAHINKLACLPVKLFCQVPNNEMTWQRKRTILFLPYSTNIASSQTIQGPHKDVSLIHKLLKQAFTLP